MNSILEILREPEGMHHAYVLEGDVDTNLSLLRGGLQELISQPIDRYPDYFECVQSNFTVAHSELFISKQSTMSFGARARFFVLAGRSFTPEAQNKLLKALEEPLPHNHIFVLTDRIEPLLPTLSSRLFVVRGDKLLTQDISSFCGQFINSSLTDRIAMIEKYLKIGGKDDEEAHLRHKTKDVISQFEKVFSDQLIGGEVAYVKGASNFLREVIEIKKYLDDSSPSVKMILEYIAFVCPFKTNN